MRTLNVCGPCRVAQWLAMGLAGCFIIGQAHCQSATADTTNEVQLANVRDFTRGLPLSPNVRGSGTEISASKGAEIVAGQELLGSKNVYLRGRLGRGLSGNLCFRFTVQGGSFGKNLTPAVSFPVAIRSHSTRFDIQNEGTFPAASEVLFTGPTGSGVGNIPASQHLTSPSEDYARYESPDMSNPAIPPGGLWQVAYKTAGLSYLLPNPQAAVRLTIPVPTAVVSNDILQTVTWSYKDANGAALKAIPPHVTRIQMEIQGLGAAGHLYDSDWLVPEVTQHGLSKTVYWSSVERMELAYTDTLGNEYVLVFRK